MIRKYAIYKGLQKPLVYRGFKGKFIGWGIGSLVIGLVSGGISGAMTSMYFGGFVTVAAITGGLFYTFSCQKKGLHSKTRANCIMVHPVHLKKNYVRTQDRI